LSDNVARTPLWGPNSLINFPDRDVAAKSGSTNNLRDAWIMGYTPNLAVGAWVGNNNNDSMGGGLSGLITTPMWREFMDVARADLPKENFPQPQINTAGLKPILRGEYIDTTSLLLALQTDTGEPTDNSPHLDISTIYNNVHSILHFVDINNPQGSQPNNPSNNAQYENWEYGVQKWNKETFGLLLETNLDQNETNKSTDDEDEEDEGRPRRGRRN
jgi:membrane carboxypeptidase/penicillin-binding protein